MTDAPAALLLAVDSWGGVASMITLAEALRGQGVNPRVAAFSDFGDKVRGAGCGFIDFGVSVAEVMAEQNEQQPGWARNPLRTWAVLRSGLKDQARAVVTSVADAVQPGEVIVSGTLTVATATEIAGLRGGWVVSPEPGADDAEPTAGGEPVSRGAAPFPAE